MLLHKKKTLVLLLALLCLGSCANGQTNDPIDAANASDPTAIESAANDTTPSSDTADPSSNGAEPESKEETETDTAPTGPAKVGQTYRDFSGTLVSGDSFTLSDHLGSVIMLNFWATWCGPCVGEMPAFPKLVEKYGDDLTLVAVNIGEDSDTVTAFLEKQGYLFPVVLDEDYTISDLYPTDGIPYTLIIGKDGVISKIHLGADDADTMFETYSSDIDAALGTE